MSLRYININRNIISIALSLSLSCAIEWQSVLRLTGATGAIVDFVVVVVGVVGRVRAQVCNQLVVISQLWITQDKAVETSLDFSALCVVAFVVSKGARQSRTRATQL